MPKNIPIVFQNGSNYDYHFIIKELAEEFKKQFTCLGENTEKFIAFTVPIEKVVKAFDKNGEEIARFMANSLSNLNTDMMIKNVKHVELNTSIATVFLNTWTLKMIS